MERAAFQSPFDLESGVAKDMHHALVVGHDVRIERLDAMIASDIGQRLEHSRANAASLQRIGDGKRDFSATCRLRVANEGRDSDEALPGFGY